MNSPVQEGRCNELCFVGEEEVSVENVPNQGSVKLKKADGLGVAEKNWGITLPFKILPDSHSDYLWTTQ